MKKYWVIAKNGAQNLLAYRFNFFAWFVTEGINVLIISYIWLSVYRQGGNIGSYSLRGLVAYFILTRVINMIFSSNEVSDAVYQDISQGQLNNYILKPMHYGLSSLARFTGDNFTAFLFALPIGLFFVIFFRDIFSVTAVNLLLFLFSLLVGSAIYFIFYYLIGLLTFFMDNIFGAAFLAWLVTSLFSGRTLPLDLLPMWIQVMANWLPFKFTLFVPMQILSGKLAVLPALSNILLGAVWFAGLWLVAQVTYNIGLKKYEGFGS